MFTIELFIDSLVGTYDLSSCSTVSGNCKINDVYITYPGIHILKAKGLKIRIWEYGYELLIPANKYLKISLDPIVIII